MLLPLICKAAPISSVLSRHISPEEPSPSPVLGKSLHPVAVFLCGGQVTLLCLERA